MTQDQIIKTLQVLLDSSNATDEYVKQIANLAKINAGLIQKHNDAIVQNEELNGQLRRLLEGLTQIVKAANEREIESLRIKQAVTDELIFQISNLSSLPESVILKNIKGRVENLKPSDSNLFVVR